MKHALLGSALLAGLGLCAFTQPSAALPMNASSLTVPAKNDLVQVRMSRREMRRHHRMRQGSASRGNAGMPSRGRSGQQYGGTAGGPRR